ncbi:unnamed protein product [Arabidopsis halleri]
MSQVNSRTRKPRRFCTGKTEIWDKRYQRIRSDSLNTRKVYACGH